MSGSRTPFGFFSSFRSFGQRSFCAWLISAFKMSKDSELSFAHRDGRLLELIDEQWAKDKLPHDEIDVPECELPPVEDSDHNGITDTLKEQDQKWTDLGIQQLQDSPQNANS